MSLTRNELAIVKRGYANIKLLAKKRDKLVETIQSKQQELDKINQEIEGFEAPIKTMTGGYSSEDILNGKMEADLQSTIGQTSTPQVGEVVPETPEIPAQQQISETTDSSSELGIKGF